MSNLLRNFRLPDMGVGYQKFQAGSPDGYLDFGVISTPVEACTVTHGKSRTVTSTEEAQ